MADRPILQVSGSLDEQKSKVQLQSQLDKIGKSLKLTVGFEQGGDPTSGIANKYKKTLRTMEDSNAELYIKMFKSQEKAEDKTRKLAQAQQKASEQAKKEIQREIDLREKLILQFEKLQNKAQLAQYTVNKYSNTDLQKGVGELNKMVSSKMNLKIAIEGTLAGSVPTGAWTSSDAQIKTVLDTLLPLVFGGGAYAQATAFEPATDIV
jgi:hypothetical protein